LPKGWTIAFADSYDEANQHALAKEADVLMPGWAAVDAGMLAAAPKLRMIQKWGIGLDRIDLAAVERAGLTLAITAGANASVVAEHAVMLMLAVYRRLSMVDRATREGRWLFNEMRGICQRLGGKTVGLVGFGHIGQMLARKLAGFDVDILYTDLARRDAETEATLAVRFVSLDDLLAQSDVVSLHVPGGDQNRHLIDAKTFSQMKPGAILINVARGDLVDEAALVKAIRSGHLMGAGLDTFELEPPSPDHPLLNLDEVVFTPHTAGSVIDNVPNVARHAFSNIQKFLTGQAISEADLVVLPQR
jgi:D-3-phosphoglycerate dehydrogenase